jgi:phospholipase/carboxylesterase
VEVIEAVEVEPSRPIQGSVVWLHGLGADGHDFEPIVPLLERPDVRFVFPHAPRRPVTINGGLIMRAWYDIRILGAPGGGEDGDDVLESTELVRRVLAREVERGMSADRIVLAGFSQGAAIALHALHRHPEPLRAGMLLSGYEVRARTREAEAAEANRGTPLLFAHGQYDPMIPLSRARAAYEAYATPGRDVAWHEFPMAHQVSPEEIVVLRDWLARRFS